MKVLVTDLDGTLYPKNDIDGLLITQNIRSLDEWHSKGNKIIIATSRGIGHLSELKRKLSMPFAFIGGGIRIDYLFVFVATVMSVVSACQYYLANKDFIFSEV